MKNEGRTVWFWRMPTGIFLVSARDGATIENDNELETRVGGRSSRKAREVAEEMAEQYDAEVKKA